MRRIRGANTGPEILVRKILHGAGFRFRSNAENLPGKPDIVLGRAKTVIFVHGCFWHSHSCQRGRRPKSNTSYWNTKLDRNVKRDRRIASKLRETGWKRVVVWECELKKPERLERRVRKALER
jgi:DNA mismatch endonuclease (patch repair protein)